MAGLLAVAAGSAYAQAGKAEIAAAVTTVKVLERPGRENLATVWDGNKYVQCRPMVDRSLRCEAAGKVMQPSLARVLTPEHVGRLAALGWTLDPSFGNHVQSFRPEVSAEDVADSILSALAQGYDADLTKLEIQTTSVASQACPPRNGPFQNLAGLISDAPSMAIAAVHTCAYTPVQDEPGQKLEPGSSTADLIRRDGSRVTAEIQRLRINRHRQVHALFDTGVGYVQCEPTTEPDGFFCEAQSADAWPPLAAVLTPERIARLHAQGFADPGRAPNYSKIYMADKTGDAALASEILTVLHDVYGYYGASKLTVTTEEEP